MTTFPSMLAVAIYGEHGLLDRRPADDEADAIRVTVEMIRERSGLHPGQRIEIQPFNPVRFAPFGEAFPDRRGESDEMLQAAE